ncbi:hypothetical protein HanIR_Chr09g0399331 [Helianthus annuus]|nr:hypothetical protein HanIR_Chr09g0399331 [Helianthus annuus]
MYGLDTGTQPQRYTTSQHLFVAPKRTPEKPSTSPEFEASPEIGARDEDHLQLFRDNTNTPEVTSELIHLLVYFL